MAHHIEAFFKEPHNQVVISDLLAAGVEYEPMEIDLGAERPLEGHTFVLTGRLSDLTRPEAKSRLEALGAKVSGSVSQKTTALIAGEDAGSKLQKASDLKVKILSEADLQALLDNPKSLDLE